MPDLNAGISWLWRLLQLRDAASSPCPAALSAARTRSLTACGVTLNSQATAEISQAAKTDDLVDRLRQSI